MTADEVEPASRPRRVLISGASGLIGSALAGHLSQLGDEVRQLVRRPARTSAEIPWDPTTRHLDVAALDGVDAVVNLSGAGVGDKRWTPSYKQTILTSRTDCTTALAEAIARSGRPVRFVSGSAVGYYGDRGDEVLTEDSAPGDGFLAEVVRAWESSTHAAEDAGSPVVHARTGLVLAPSGGALAPLVQLAKLGIAGPFGRGRMWWPWISLLDEVAALTFLIDHEEVTGPVNLVAPAADRQKDVIASLASRMGRPSLVPAPPAAMRLVVGQFADEILASQRVVPTRLRAAGFEHTHATLEQAMEWLVPALD